MQVYLALYDEQDDYLIAKKRVINSWWQGAQKQPALVNQAGQWCFPGGGANGGDYVREAKREFQEETGCVVPDCDSEEVLGSNPSYRLVRCRISGGKLNTLMHTADLNLRAGVSGASRPSDGVEDWELSEFTMVPKIHLAGILGVKVAVRQDTSAHPPRGRFSQSIDWYGEMARLIAAQ